MRFGFRYRRPLPIGRIGRMLLAGLTCLTLGAMSDPGVARQFAEAGTSGAAPAATSREIRIGVIGDSLAEDLWYGLDKVLGARKNVKVAKYAKAATGLIRDDVYDWQDAVRDVVRESRFDAIIVLIGGNDRQSIWIGSRRVSRGSKAWLREYERRVARFMDVLASTGARVYWVGLPAVRSERMSRDYRTFNGIFRAQARRHGFAYVEIWDDFIDQDGAYTSFGRAPDGATRQLRKEDGLHFTPAGKLRLGEVVARELARELGGTRVAR